MHNDWGALAPLCQSLAEVEAVLASCPLFAEVAPGQLNEIARKCTTIRAYAGQTLMEEGPPSRDILYLLRGRVSLLVESIAPFVEVPIARLGPGEVLGEAAVINDRERHVTVVTEMPCDLLVVPARFVRQMAEADPVLAATLYRNTARIATERLRRGNRRLVTMRRRTAWREAATNNRDASGT